MRILAITPWLSTRKRPVLAPFMQRDIELLQEDHEVITLHLVSPADLSEDEIDIPGLNLVRVPYHHTMPWTWPGAIRAVRRYARGADLIHTMALPALIPTWLAHLKLPWVHTEHYGMLISKEATPRQKRAIGLLAKLEGKPDHVVAVGPELAAVIEDERGHDGAVSIIGNHVAIDSEPRRTPAEELGRDRQIRMIAVGGLVPHKGPVQAVETLAELRRRGLDAQLTWVGGGVLEEAVRKRAAELGVEDHLVLPGPVQPEDLGGFLRGANVFILPTEHETFGVAIAEALGYGLPVVTSGIGGHLDLLPKQGSRVVERREAELLADAVESLRGDPELMSTLELVAHARRLFSHEDRLKAYEEVYNGVL